ncbi:23S rRNA (pseudouridine(1915)-N(3))-methyltransferase RlmH [Parvibium lacunae]|uniref:Ribosomal RNA large subunit methyltransferase H n=1 Tax=Parvibium lacunae TaxID=1888893 RepID=A0A368L3Y7_9BURK|nr:23S rRNA (pseudouridine(1915)-N(3))-methyltransferase RlmH [Parvibium lacunae]RCS58277.1 23S rRNA (pseudouridine(1915)-N(3))-methyltransferase RlmH [Parvibium lacunae]
MPFHLLAVGHKMPAWIQTGYQEYAKRLLAEWQLTLKEIKPEPRSGGKTPAQMMRAEADRIEAALPKHSFIVVLDERGQTWPTQVLSQQIQAWQQQYRDITFVIGGADGLDPVFKENAHERLRLSSLTLPHGLVRVLLAEQLYRAWSLTVGHPYHRD